MPQIIVTADRDSDLGDEAVTLRERINASDFESSTFGQRLVERLGWAVADAHDVEQQAATTTEEQTLTSTEDAEPSAGEPEPQPTASG
jgi:hypothetical protein